MKMLGLFVHLTSYNDISRVCRHRLEILQRQDLQHLPGCPKWACWCRRGEGRDGWNEVGAFGWWESRHNDGSFSIIDRASEIVIIVIQFALTPPCSLFVFNRQWLSMNQELRMIYTALTLHDVAYMMLNNFDILSCRTWCWYLPAYLGWRIIPNDH